MPVLKFRKPVRSVLNIYRNLCVLVLGAQATKALGALDTEIWPGSQQAVQQVQNKLACRSIRFGTKLIRGRNIFVAIIQESAFCYWSRRFRIYGNSTQINLENIENYISVPSGDMWSISKARIFGGAGL